ncbi:MAG: glycogen debranching protein GlgX [Ignavibacteriales bacterium]|nr:glycogen debranching protein GlgX [Ignavibacteriales bacterium]
MTKKKQKISILDVVTEQFEIVRGHPLPLGPTSVRGGVNFSLFSRHATDVSLVLFAQGQAEPLAEFPLDPRYNKTGDIWHACIRGLDPGVEYGFRVEMSGNPALHLHRFDADKILVDPYSRSLSGGEIWGRGRTDRRASWLRRSCVIDPEFDWKYDQPLNRHLADSIIYELHVRGFTRHPSSGVSHPGTFHGLSEKIPYLRDLGVTAVELMPVNDFLETDCLVRNPATGEQLLNFWGYHPISFFALKASYASNPSLGAEVREFKSMVKDFHDAGIEVILDMVFNHTGEGDEQGATISFRGLDNPIYYIVDPNTGGYLNFSGCGNTMNCNHPVVRDLILGSLRYWVTEMHVDGFRFDLASILGRGTDGSVLANPPLLERIAADPVLANVKLIAEAWDAAGLYQVGSFPSWGRWAEWNARFRDDVRQFWKGEPDKVRSLATRFCGSADLYRGSGRAPFHSVNFITSHDGFTLADLVSYNEKHNEANGEQNRDGLNGNDSWNCGEEGPTADPSIQKLRNRQIKNLAATLLLSQGVPMILAGDEIGRTQSGNNNAYCQDNETSWLDWVAAENNKDLLRFFKCLIAFRLSHTLFRQRKFIGQGSEIPRIIWHGTEPYSPDWSWHSKSIAVELQFDGQDDDLYFVFNAFSDELTFRLPPPAGVRQWRRFLDTSLTSPHDFADPGDKEATIVQDAYVVSSRTVIGLRLH